MSNGYKKGLDGGKIGFIEEVLHGDKYRRDYEAGVRTRANNEDLAIRIADKLEENRNSGSSYDCRESGYDSEPSVSFRERFSRLSLRRKIVEGLFYSWLAIWEGWYFYCLYAVITKTPESDKLIFLPFFKVWSLTRGVSGILCNSDNRRRITQWRYERSYWTN